MSHDPFPRDRVAATLRRMPAYLKLAWRLVKDPLLGRARRAAVVAAAGYLASPIDLVPGVIPVVGQLDDVAVALGALRFALAGLDAERRREHLAAVGLEDGDLAEDLRTVGAASAWLVRAGARTTARAAAAGGKAVAKGAKATATKAVPAAKAAIPAAASTARKAIPAAASAARKAAPGARSTAAKAAPLARDAASGAGTAAKRVAARAGDGARSAAGKGWGALKGGVASVRPSTGRLRRRTPAEADDPVVVTRPELPALGPGSGPADEHADEHADDAER